MEVRDIGNGSLYWRDYADRSTSPMPLDGGIPKAVPNPKRAPRRQYSEPARGRKKMSPHLGGYGGGGSSHSSSDSGGNPDPERVPPRKSKAAQPDAYDSVSSESNLPPTGQELILLRKCVLQLEEQVQVLVGQLLDAKQGRNSLLADLSRAYAEIDRAKKSLEASDRKH